MPRSLRDNYYSKKPDDLIVPLELGGTDANNVNDARIKLESLDITTKGQSTGPVPVEFITIEGFPPSVDVKIPEAYFNNKHLFEDTVYGTFTANLNEVKTYTISNYDFNRSYNLIPIGSARVHRDDDKITFIAPSVHVDTGFILNDKTYTVVLNP